ncbi:hypothetical protein F5X99DRAFT_404218 [Biscogniauxia marginata]|nr:hypothetical protein F5X99DRAFT_404218 [Biscogniauxia marginata]
MHLFAIFIMIVGSVDCCLTMRFPGIVGEHDMAPRLTNQLNETSTQLASRGIAKLICGKIDDRGFADNSRITEGIQYLRTLGPSLARVEPGPARCDRVSCSWDSAIWLCNDRTDVLGVNWTDVADFAQAIQSNCHGMGYRMAGEFDDDQDWNTGWNVVIGASDC